MAQRFRWTPRGYEADLEQAEVRLLRGLVKDVVTLLEGRREQVRADAADAPPAGHDAADPFWSLVGGLDVGREGGRAAPEDAAVARLLPDSLPDAAPEEAARQRALTEDAVTDAKLDDARRALEVLRSTRLSVAPEHAASFGRALNDVRLVLAARLGVETDEDAARIHDVDHWRRAEDVESTMALLYNFTTWLLETLMEEMLRELPDDGPSGPGTTDEGSPE
ncbi:DUF2017 family protein [Micrococcus sp.]|uniref:DUF2017 family protein n=1 Tax=Micrococcus sp. TaxID=1271 RepID=UPI002A9169AE|nr:DUF2017 family protein [Micrococcus sp.]MDY6055704.1 DUF2017 family protein [Micrococcus sp.]